MTNYVTDDHSLKISEGTERERLIAQFKSLKNNNSTHGHKSMKYISLEAPDKVT